MATLPVCSATACCSSHSQIPFYGRLRSFSSCWKTYQLKCNVVDLSTSFHLNGPSFRGQSPISLYSQFVHNSSLSSSSDSICTSCRNVFDGVNRELLTSDARSNSTGNLRFVDSSAVPIGREEMMDFNDDLVNIANFSPESANLESITTVDLTQGNPASILDSLDLDTSSLSNVKSSALDVLSQVNKSITGSVENGQSYLNSSLDGISSSVTSAVRGATQAVDDVISKLTSTVDKTGDSAGNGVAAFSTGLKEVSGRVGLLAIDALRHIILIVEDLVSRGATLVVYSYGSVKEVLPMEVQDLLNVSEERAVKLLTPFGTALGQGYVALEGLERSLGLDPSDPIIPFVLFLGVSTSFWAFYWILTYGGYAGDLSPKSSFELLKGDRNAVLIDIRPEDLREKEGIPDLRRAARFRFANVTLPEIDGSTRKLFKSGRELDDYLLASVIRNLKIVQDRSQVIVMDADGNRSKGIARSLRRLGIKRPYLVQGGFRSWVEAGLRIKELKPETTLTILNEEAEAIFEEINPTPLQVVGYGVGLVAAAYALVEWEKTLQYVGVFGLCQTLYRRISSYEDSEDFKQDVRQLLAPVILGGQAMTWAVGKLETSRNGLPTSPSSTDVQSRVLQAAAKHESQPDSEETQDPSPETMLSVSENIDLSEA
ncbi:hypothetical protein KY290_019656 [Solanum tuberosum]|uniref:Rhodanese domain-containing protein n=1 Tax=Solanum tuberosum TaxID=4113 RepID=A0ABQ7VJS8_SOLTU|nr:hypothetical protein KY284_019046 [Solanum tuberosum]KAH0704303.1 hypothetical protein KY285_018581 [Solanum tuberosum]KAH0763583.1 hypothetical protein KY290_019656 [Solanum tuberosum]